jgi:D-tyrosyl-tRNA(Tyr) deacylase
MLRAVVQRVSHASVSVDGEVLSAIGEGLVVYLGVQNEDGAKNRSAREVGAEILVISQFTVVGDCRRGRRPSFTDAMAPQPARELYESFIETLRKTGFGVSAGRFRALMDVQSVNHGPVTVLLDSRRTF